MKKLITIVIGLVACVSTFAQGVSINSSGMTAHPSALLDVNSTTKGFLLPRMTTQQRNSIVAPAEGLILYDTDREQIWGRTGSGWASMGGLWKTADLSTMFVSGMKVGIGTATPQYDLSVQTFGIGISQKAENGVAEIGFFTAQAYAYIQTHTNVPLRFTTNNEATQMTLTTGGNLGIGPQTSEATARLEVNGHVKVSGNLTVWDGKGVVHGIDAAPMKMKRSVISLSGTSLDPDATLTSGYLTFDEDFLSAMVIVGNCVSPSGPGSQWHKILIMPFDVDPELDRCRFKIFNTGDTAITFSASWEVIIIGN